MVETKDEMTTENTKQTSEINTNEHESFISDIIKDLGIEASTSQKKKKKRKQNKNKSKGHVIEGSNNEASPVWIME